MTAESVTGIGPGSSEGPLRGFDLDNIRKVLINSGGDLLPCIIVQGNIQPGGGDEVYVLRAVADGQVKVTSTDLPDYLVNKLVAGVNIVLTPNPGPDESITISAGGGSTPIQLVGATPYTCPIGTSVRDAVYSNGSNSVDKANATSIATAPVLGFVIQKPTSTSCVVCYAGELGGFVGLTPSAVYYLSTTPGAITTTAPSSSGNVVQPVGIARNSTTLVIGIKIDVTL